MGVRRPKPISCSRRLTFGLGDAGIGVVGVGLSGDLDDSGRGKEGTGSSVPTAVVARGVEVDGRSTFGEESALGDRDVCRGDRDSESETLSGVPGGEGQGTSKKFSEPSSSDLDSREELG